MEKSISKRAIWQGSVDNVIVLTLNGVSNSMQADQKFERSVLKRKVELFDVQGKLIIG